jgi:hypothetical protein
VEALMEEYTPDNRAREAKEKEIEELLTEFARELDANPELLRQLMGTYITLTRLLSRHIP